MWTPESLAPRHNFSEPCTHSARWGLGKGWSGRRADDIRAHDYPRHGDLALGRVP